MAKARGPGSSGGQRTLVGLQVETYLKIKGWSQKQLATAVGIEQPKLNDMLAGRRSLSNLTLKRITEKLGNCTVSDLMSDELNLKWPGVHKRFALTFGDLVDKPWYFFAHSDWSTTLPEECLSKGSICFSVLLKEVRGFNISSDAAGISPFLGECATFLERAYRQNIPDSGRLLLDVCDRLVHCLSFTYSPLELKRAAEPYLEKMRLVFESTQATELGTRLWDRQADVLKLLSGHDAGALASADDYLKRALRSGSDLSHGFETIRNRVLVGCKVAWTEPEFARVIRLGESALDAWRTPDGQRLILEAIGVACADRYHARGKVEKYRKMALDCYRRASALETATSVTEAVLRVKRLPLRYAALGIPDDVSADGREIESLKRLTCLAGSVRVAREIDVLECELKKIGIVKV